jgi:hypothetical protein
MAIHKDIGVSFLDPFENWVSKCDVRDEVAIGLEPECEESHEPVVSCEVGPRKLTRP